MATASTRGLRSKSSRFSSPATTTEKDAEGKSWDLSSGKNTPKTFLDKWIEPPLRAPAPSFEDTKGLERVGVLEHMAPLGQPPTQKLLQKLKLGSHKPVLRTTLGQSEEAATPSTEVDRLDMASPADVEMVSVSDQPEEVAPPLNSGQKGRMRQENGDESLGFDQTPSPMKATFPPSTSVSPKAAASTSSSLAPPRLQAHFDAAIGEAEKSGSSNLVPGLRKLYDDALVDPELLSVLEAILSNTPSQAQFKIFKRYIKHGIKRFDNPNSELLMDVDLRPRIWSRSRSGASSHAFPNSADSPIPSAAQHSSASSPIRLKQHSNHRHYQVSPSKLSSGILANANMASARSNGLLAGVGPSPRRRRSRSVSSSSSLSSAKSIPETFAPLLDTDGAAQLNGVRPARSSGSRQAANRVAAGNKTRSSATVSHPPKHPFSDFKTTSQFAAKKFKKSKEDLNIDQAEIEKRRRELEQRSFLDYNVVAQPDSSERMAVTSIERPRSSLSITVPPPVVHPHPLNPSSALLSSPVSLNAPPEQPLINGSRRKRGSHEMDPEDSDMPTPSSSPGPLLVPPPPDAAVSSRAATPRAAKLPPPGKARKSARVMISPNKPKNGGITAGISRAGPGRDSVIGNGAESSAEDNDEYCASCGGEGTLLCCDGCPNSFHHACLEPPLDPEADVDGEWFCPRCNARRNRGRISTSGLFGPLLRRTDDTIPKAFTLPFTIRDYFEGVKTGEEGEYEEIGLPRTQNNAVKMNRAGFIEEPNYKELRDSKNNFIVCYHCGLTSNGRDIIPCDYCPARWHLDCLDPPLAVPPRRRQGDKPNATWRCPLHIEHDLNGIGKVDLAAPGDMGRIPRLRRPKHATASDIELPRGSRNNGIVDIELMKEEDNKIKEVEMFGTIYRLSEKGVRLDFIDRVKRSWYEDQTFPPLMHSPLHIREQKYRPDVLPRLPSSRGREIAPADPASKTSPADRLAIEASAMANATLRRKTFREQQAVLQLANLSGKDIHSEALADLTNQLIINAPEGVGEAIDRGQIEGLERLIALAQARLDIIAGGKVTRTKSMVNGDATGPNADVDDEAEGDGDAGSEMDISS